MPTYTEGTYVAVIVNVLWISVVAWVLVEFIRRLNIPLGSEAVTLFHGEALDQELSYSVQETCGDGGQRER